MTVPDGRFLGGLALATGLVASTIVASRALVRIQGNEAIQVTGSAKRRIRSDLVVWTARVSARAPDLAAAYRALAAGVPKVAAYVEGKGIPATEVALSSVSTRALHPRDREGREMEEVVSGYEMTRTIEVRSRDVDRVTRVSREATELIEQGIALESDPPEYHYTKLGDLKVQMLAEAARDARTRAEQIASSTGARIGALRSARMGVIQINPADSTEVSNEGNNDTSSLEKDILTVVAGTFALR
jgi:hypothetical protein